MNVVAKYALFAIAVWSGVLAGSSQMVGGSVQGKLQGEVVDVAEGAPIQYAFVIVHSSSGNKDITLEADRHGHYELFLAPGLYDVLVAAAGFAPFCKKIEITSDHTITLRVRLGPDSEHLQPAFR